VHRQSKALSSAFAALLVALASGSAGAQTVSDRPAAFNLQLFEPAPSSRSMLTVDLPAVAPHLAVTAGLWVNHAPSVLRADGRDLVSSATQVEAQVALGLFQLFEVGFALPLVHQTVTSFSGTCGRPGVTTCPTLGDDASHTSLGDLRFFTKVPLLRGQWPVAVRVGVAFPSGNDGAYAGAAYWSLSPTLLASHAFGALTVAANLGARLNESNASPYLSVNDELTASIGLRYDFSWRVAILAEGLVRVPLDAADAGRFNRRAFVAANTTPSAEVFLAASVGVTRAINAYVGLGKGLSEGYGASDVRGFAGLRLTVERQPCAYGPEDADGFRDDDFCADPDNDEDGVPDELDRCPNDAEDRDGVLDEDGCADPDNDGDGIPDDRDRCPVDPEDFDRFQNDDGCPDLDNDHDRVADIVDHCPDEAEDVDNFQDDDGCPEPGPDALVVTRTDSRLLVSQRIYFDYDSDTIRDVSFPVLDEVAAAIRRNDDIQRLRVEGHTDQAGTPEYNLDLSFRRARAVVEYLTAHGVARNRLEFQGFGQQAPVAELNSPDAASLNRRVEFTIVQQHNDAPPAPAPTAPGPDTNRHERRHRRRH
jgi:outer membrane protein OmpA-like peptidoglycan-associated protein